MDVRIDYESKYPTLWSAYQTSQTELGRVQAVIDVAHERLVQSELHHGDEAAFEAVDALLSSVVAFLRQTHAEMRGVIEKLAEPAR